MCMRDFDSDMSDILGDRSEVSGSPGSTPLALEKQLKSLSSAELVSELVESEESDELGEE